MCLKQERLKIKFLASRPKWNELTRQLSEWLEQYASQELLHFCGDAAREQADGRENKLGSFPRACAISRRYSDPHIAN